MRRLRYPEAPLRDRKPRPQSACWDRKSLLQKNKKIRSGEKRAERASYGFGPFGNRPLKPDYSVLAYERSVPIGLDAGRRGSASMNCVQHPIHKLYGFFI